MKTKRLLVLALLLACCLLMTGCHGSDGSAAFAIPQQFDTNRQFEVSFWAKNDTNKTQTAIYEKAIADFETLYHAADRALYHVKNHGKGDLHVYSPEDEA